MDINTINFFHINNIPQGETQRLIYMEPAGEIDCRGDKGRPGHFNDMIFSGRTIQETIYFLKSLGKISCFFIRL